MHDARGALETAIHDCVADFGEDAAEAGYFDLVRYVAQDCTPAVRSRLLQQAGLE